MTAAEKRREEERSKVNLDAKHGDLKKKMLWQMQNKNAILKE